MGTTISILLPEQQSEQGTQIVRTLFSEWESTLSRFLPESELSRLNQQAGKPVAVSELLYQVLATALTAAQATQGVYDPAMLDQLVQLGYDRTFDELEPREPRSPTGWRANAEVFVDEDAARAYVEAGAAVDLGGIGKGFSAERSSMRYRSIRPDDASLRSRLRELASQRRRFGYRRLLVLLRREGTVVNHKKLRRLYREERLQVRKRGGRKRALGTRVPMTVPQGANRSCADLPSTPARRAQAPA